LAIEPTGKIADGGSRTMTFSFDLTYDSAGADDTAELRPVLDRF
jgi:hypothetical protein